MVTLESMYRPKVPANFMLEVRRNLRPNVIPKYPYPGSKSVSKSEDIWKKGKNVHPSRQSEAFANLRRTKCNIPPISGVNEPTSH